MYFMTDCLFTSYSLNLFLVQNFFFVDLSKIKNCNFIEIEGKIGAEIENRLPCIKFHSCHWEKNIRTHKHTTNVVIYIYAVYQIYIYTYLLRVSYSSITFVLSFLTLTVDALCVSITISSYE